MKQYIALIQNLTTNRFKTITVAAINIKNLRGRVETTCLKTNEILMSLYPLNSTPVEDKNEQ